MKNLRLLLCFLLLGSASFAATMKEADQLYQDGNYAEALSQFEQLLEAGSGITPDEAAHAIELGRRCLERLDLVKLDSFLEKAVAGHGTSWQVLLAVAKVYNRATHLAELVDGEYQRSWGRYDSTKRDRVRALQLLESAFGSIQQAKASDQSDFWESTAGILQTAESWRLQELSDLSSLPDYEEQSHHDARNAPVGPDGTPVFHQLPTTWEAAKSDGERWRWALSQMEALGGSHRLQALSLRARFLQSQFGVQTLASVWHFSGEDDAEKAQLLARKLRELKDHETIAYFATGPQKITLPKEHNHLELWKEIAAANFKNSHIETALSELAQIHIKRDQRPQAADYVRTALQIFGREHSKKLLQQLTGNYGGFDGTRTEAAGDPVKVGFVYRNASEVKLQARRINVKKLLDDVKAYLRSNPKDWDWQEANIENIGQRLLEEDQQQYLEEEVASWSVELEPREGHLERRVSIATPLQQAGAFWLEAHVSEGNKTSVIVWLSDTAIVRKPLDGKFHHYIADAKSGEGIANAEVEFFGWDRDRGRLQQNKWKINVSAQTKQTNQQGEVIFQQGGRDRKQWLVTAETEQGQFGYLGFRSMWARDYQNAQPDTIRIFSITDRPAYRPGDTVNFKAWVGRSRYDQELAGEFEGRPVKITVQAPNGEKAYEAQDLTADQYGGVSGQFVLGEDATLGAYRIRIESRKVFGSGNFRVEEYKKPEFEVLVEAPDEPITLGDRFTATVKANYYFGAPVTSGEVQVKVTREPHHDRFFPVRPWDWLYGRGYAFHLPEQTWYPGWNSWGCIAPRRSWIPWRQPEPEVVLNETFSLGADGTVRVEVDSALAKELHGDTDHEYAIKVEVTDESRRTIKGSGSVIAARAPFEVFVALDRGFYEAGDTMELTAVARTPDGKPVKGEGTITLYAISYDSEGDAQETEVHRESVAASQDGQMNLQLKAAKPGQYRLSCKMKTESGEEAEGARIVTVRSGDFDGADFRFNALELIPDKSTYATGEVMKLLINAEQEGSTVVLFLDPVNGVYQEPVLLNLQGKSMVYEHAIEARDHPNFFVEAYTVSDGDIHQVTQEVVVPPQERTLNLEVVADSDDYRPDTEAKLSVKLTNGDGTPFVGQTVLAVYDKAIEYISGGSNVSDIRSFFWSWKRRHHPQVEDNLSRYFPNLPMTSEDWMQNFGLGLVGIDEYGDDAFADAMPVIESAAPGRAMQKTARVSATMAADAEVGGALQEGGGEQLVEATVRADFADSIFWAAGLETDKQGMASVSIDLPDNLTTWKIRGWGLGKGTRVGQGESEFTTSKKLVLRQQAPRFFVEKDQVVLSANVHNYLDRTVEAKVSLELENSVLKAMDPKSMIQVVTLDSGAEMRLDWRVKAQSEGEALILMKALTNIESDAVEIRYPVYVHGMLKTESWSGVVRPDEETANLTFNVPAERKPEQSQLEVRFSPSIAAAMVDALPYLIDYPYGCTEQTVNRFIPCVITRKVLDDVGIDLKAIRDKAVNLNPQELGEAQSRASQWKRQIEDSPVFNDKKLDRLITKGSQKLTDMQNADGGWGWFTDASSPHTTAIVVYGLQQGIRAKAKIDQGAYERGLQWLMRHEREQLRRLQLADGEKGRKNSADHLDAYVASILTAEQRGEAGMLDLLYRDRAKLTLYSNALLGMALHDAKRNQERDMIVRNIEQFLEKDKENQSAYLKLNNGGYWWHWYGNQIETQAAYLKLLVAIDPKSETASGVVKYLLNNRRHGTYWYNTRDTAACIDAIADYFVKSGEARPEMTVQLLLDGQVRKNVEIGKKDLFSYDNQLLVKAEDLADGEHQLEFRKSGTGPLYFNAYLTNFTKEDPITKTGLEVKVERRFWKLIPKDAQATVSGQAGQVVEQDIEAYDRERLNEESVLQSGDQVEVELIIESKNDYSYILIEDMKAAGMEPVDVRSGYFGQLGAYRELRDEKVAFFLRHLPQGQHTLRYRIKAEIPGKFSALPTKIMGMYAPELVGNADEAKIQIEDAK